MFSISRRTVLAGGLFSLAGCGGGKFIQYDGPEVTRVVVQKADRRMYLMHQRKVIRRYAVQLGFTAEGPKQFYGDGKTPEGRYHIDRRNPNSAFFLSVGIDYPNDRDKAYADAMGKDPGGDIFIHGWGDEPRERSEDWTAGCVAVTNHEMKLVYAMVRNGTPVDIFA